MVELTQVFSSLLPTKVLLKTFVVLAFQIAATQLSSSSLFFSFLKFFDLV